MELSNQDKFDAYARRGDLKMLKFLLLQPDVDPAADDNTAFRWASENGHLDVLKFLLPLPGVDPAANKNYAFRWAASNGHLEVLKFLLPLPGVDPTARNNSAFRFASMNGHLDVIELLKEEEKTRHAALNSDTRLINAEMIRGLLNHLDKLCIHTVMCFFENTWRIDLQDSYARTVYTALQIFVIEQNDA